MMGKRRTVRMSEDELRRWDYYPMYEYPDWVAAQGRYERGQITAGLMERHPGWDFVRRTDNTTWFNPEGPLPVPLEEPTTYAINLITLLKAYEQALEELENCKAMVDDATRMHHALREENESLRKAYEDQRIRAEQFQKLQSVTLSERARKHLQSVGK